MLSSLGGESVSEESFAKICLVPGTQNAGLEISVRLVRETLKGKKSQRLSSCILLPLVNCQQINGQEHLIRVMI